MPSSLQISRRRPTTIQVLRHRKPISPNIKPHLKNGIKLIPPSQPNNHGSDKTQFLTNQGFFVTARRPSTAVGELACNGREPRGAQSNEVCDGKAEELVDLDEIQKQSGGLFLLSVNRLSRTCGNMDLDGIEPTTPTMPLWCSPS